jgi:ABC-type branched-subunit amino acid transport system ATPase component
MSAVFQASEVSVSYGGVHALAGVSLEVGEGELVGLIGPNGAGKTTFIDAVTGFVASEGSVSLDGADISPLSLDARARRGLRRTWQSAELFDDLTVAENVAVALPSASWRDSLQEALRGRPAPSTVVAQTLEMLELGGYADRWPDDLSHGQRKLVGVARALAPGPRILCLDEPAAGLDTDESARLGAHLRSIADAGTAIMLIDHDMGLVLSICDRVHVLEFGQTIAEGTCAEIRDDPRVVAAYLGTSSSESEART